MRNKCNIKDALCVSKLLRVVKIQGNHLPKCLNFCRFKFSRDFNFANATYFFADTTDITFANLANDNFLANFANYGFLTKFVGL